jgi:hypothetical protein
MTLSLKSGLAGSTRLVLSLYAVIASFCTYSCMYALRKPIAVATFDGISYGGVDYKILVLTAQVIGYTVSKFAGIKIVSEMKGAQRAMSIFILICIALISLLFFAIVPPPFNIAFLFLNGLPLGMIWGLVFSYLEGRQSTELLGAGLSISFIFSSGFVKSIGKMTMEQWGASELWMPFVTGLLFIIPAIFFIWMLDQVPPPTQEDERLRTKRQPMNKMERKAFVMNFGPGLFLLITLYIFLTAFRDFRDNFSAELWQNLGYGESALIFTSTEIPVSLGVLFILGLVILIKKNINAFMILHLIILAGILMVGIGTMAFEHRLISPPIWMILVGLGLYLAYVPFNSVLFDRLIASFKYVSNAGFIIYLADAFGYLGSTFILLYKNFEMDDLSWLNFFITCSYILMVAGVILIIGSILYFRAKYKVLIHPVTEVKAVV